MGDLQRPRRQRQFTAKPKRISCKHALESQTGLDKNQKKKIAKKSEVLEEVCTMLGYIAEDSDLRQKQEEVIEAARAQLKASGHPQAMDGGEDEEGQPQAFSGGGEDQLSPSHVAGEIIAADEARKPRWSRGGRSRAVRKAERRSRE